MIISSAHTNSDSSPVLGGKANGLLRLKEMKVNVPEFVILSEDYLSAFVTSSANPDKIILPATLQQELLQHFKIGASLAVRSSATEEDSVSHSFAGVHKSFLHVQACDVFKKIEEVWSSAFSPAAVAYRRQHNLQPASGLSVIVQDMIAADVSGIAFSQHPLSGNKDEVFVNAVWGLGERLASGAEDADAYSVSATAVKKVLTEKKTQLGRDIEKGFETGESIVPLHLQQIACLDDSKLFSLRKTVISLEEAFGYPVDVEFAWKNGLLYILQVRAITTLSTKTESREYHIVWDNSNIIESYPGVTSVLTFSFIKKSYEIAYRQFSKYLGVQESVLQQNEKIFANTLGLLHGRVYYNLRSWYLMLAMLPGYSINARFMEKMMGVEERFDVPADLQLSKTKAWLSVIRMGANMYRRFLNMRKTRKEFYALVNETFDRYQKIDFTKESVNTLLILYKEFYDSLLSRWKAPLLNDFYAMIFYGRLQKKCAAWLGNDYPNIHNDLLCGSDNIISVQPVQRSLAIADFINRNEVLKDKFLATAPKAVWDFLQGNINPQCEQCLSLINAYIKEFGERCVGELKLESISYAQKPEKFILLLQSYLKQSLGTTFMSEGSDSKIRENAEKKMVEALKNKPVRLWKLRRILAKTRELVSARENLRFERTRAFGVVRSIFSAVGARLAEKDILASDRDVFFLTVEEIFSYAEGTSYNIDLKSLVALRKIEYEKFHLETAPPSRLTTYGMTYPEENFTNYIRLSESVDSLQGIGCSPGIVKGKIILVNDPEIIPSLNGEILVATSTDPGWISLFASASGIITERGSILSHSAIVSREMGKPCIVAVKGIMQQLKTGDEIEMNGSTGVISILNKT